MSDFDPTLNSILELPAKERNDRLQSDTQARLEELKLCLVTSSRGQEEIVEFLVRYEGLSESVPMAPRSLRAIRDGQSGYLRLQDSLIKLSKRYTPLLADHQKDTRDLQLDPDLRAKALLISLVAALTLYDNHLAMRAVLKETRLRRLMLAPGQAPGIDRDEIVDALRELNSSEKQARLEQLVNAYDQLEDRLSAASDPDLDFLQMAVDSSAAYRFARESLLNEQLPSTSRRWRERILDVFDGIEKSTMGTISELFGNGIGLVETRKGKLWQNTALEKHLTQTLQPLDMLLEKTPFRLTDKFIPGHFGHVAIWVGSAAELAELDIFSDPMFQQPRFAGCEADVANGRSVLEALRTDVQLSSLAEFLNVDDLAILRPQGLTSAQKRASLIRAFRQVGKHYDFNFEVQTLDEVTCSELPYHIYPAVSWQTVEQLGRHTISPDQVASQALTTDAPFQLVEFCHDGHLVDPPEALPLMTRLLGEELA